MSACPCCAGSDTGEAFDLCDVCLEAWMHEQEHECARSNREIWRQP